MNYTLKGLHAFYPSHRDDSNQIWQFLFAYGGQQCQKLAEIEPKRPFWNAGFWPFSASNDYFFPHQSPISSRKTLQGFLMASVWWLYTPKGFLTANPPTCKIRNRNSNFFRVFFKYFYRWNTKFLQYSTKLVIFTCFDLIHFAEN